MGKKAGDLPRDQRTVYRLLKHAASVWGHAPALHQPETQESYRTWSWIEYRQAAEEIACGLRALGIGLGETVGLASETRAEFYLADAGVMTNGSIAAAVYTSLPAFDQARTLLNCEPKAVFVENPRTLRALDAAGLSRLDAPKILLTGEAEEALTLSSLRELGAKAMLEDRRFFDRIEAEVRPEHYAILYLTSGATGEPKMGLVTHNAIVANVDMGPKVIDLDDDDSTLAFLPSAHITQRLVMELLMMRMGVPVFFSEGLSKLPAELRRVRPTFFIAPPRVWERMYASITTEIRKKPAIVRRLFYMGVGVGNEATRAREQGRQPAPWVKSSLRLFDRLVFSKIRDRLGGRMRIAVSGAAPLGRELAAFYSSIGLGLIEGYGLTEGGVVALNPVNRPIAGSIGVALPGAELKRAEDGELLIRGETLFSGYFRDAASTAAVLRDGWLHTGDIAEVDSNGYWYITGRKKELIVSSNGKKIYPARIEGLFKLNPLINQVLLIGDRLPYMTALITVNSGEGDRTSHAVREEVNRIVKSINRQLASFEQVRRFKILDRDFSLENGELTPTMKLRRGKVLDNFKAEIAELYLGREDI